MCWLRVTRCVLLVVWRVVVACGLLCVACCLMFAVRRVCVCCLVLYDVSCVLCVVYCLVGLVPRLLFVVRCLPSVKRDWSCCSL